MSAHGKAARGGSLAPMNSRATSASTPETSRSNVRSVRGRSLAPIISRYT